MARIFQTFVNQMHLVWLQVHQRAAEKWKDIDATKKSLQMCMISNMLKVECCVNGTHSLDDVGLGAWGLYQTLPGLDCTFSGLVLQIYSDILFFYIINVLNPYFQQFYISYLIL